MAYIARNVPIVCQVVVEIKADNRKIARISMLYWQRLHVSEARNVFIDENLLLIVQII